MKHPIFKTCYNVNTRIGTYNMERKYKMKITVIHGQSHKGSTYHIAKMLYEKFCPGISTLFVSDAQTVLKSQKSYVLIMKI